MAMNAEDIELTTGGSNVAERHRSSGNAIVILAMSLQVYNKINSSEWNTGNGDWRLSETMTSSLNISECIVVVYLTPTL